jgi:hypothetical protein
MGWEMVNGKWELGIGNWGKAALFDDEGVPVLDVQEQLFGRYGKQMGHG